ncbi:MAG: hypothetical protein ACYST5_15355 [Planctomycetota bacterium]
MAPIASCEARYGGVVDMADVETMASERLASGAGLEADLDSDEKVDFKVFAENRLWEQ